MKPIVFVIVATLALVTGCGREAEQPPTEPAAARAPSGAATGAAQDLEIAFVSDTDALKMGENQLEVTVRQPDGTPVTDADVLVEFYMRAMPEMNMAEMRNSVALEHESDGRYRGAGNIMMSGGWDATVKVSRNGAEVASRSFPVKAQ